MSLFFKEVFNVGLSVSNKLFKQPAIINAPLLLTTRTDKIVDMLFKPIGGITDVAVATVMVSMP